MVDELNKSKTELTSSN